MRNDLNLFIMTPEEVAQWYRPQSPEEQYLVDIIAVVDSNTHKDLKDEVEDLADDLERQQRINDDLDCDIHNLQKENISLNSQIEELEDKITGLEYENGNLLGLVTDLQNDISKLQSQM